jgi:hypothetical protein
MSVDNWGRIKELFLKALDMPAPERMAFVAEGCGGDALLRAEVERLLIQHEEAEGFMSRPAVENTALRLFTESFDGGNDPLVGETVGAYRLTLTLTKNFWRQQNICSSAGNKEIDHKLDPEVYTFRVKRNDRGKEALCIDSGSGDDETCYERK